MHGIGHDLILYVHNLACAEDSNYTLPDNAKLHCASECRIYDTKVIIIPASDFKQYTKIILSSQAIMWK